MVSVSNGTLFAPRDEAPLVWKHITQRAAESEEEQNKGWKGQSRPLLAEGEVFRA